MDKISKNYCCIQGCGSNLKPMHRFPNPRRQVDRFQMWLEASENPRYKNLTNEQIYRRGFVCSKHFKATDFRPGRKYLNDSAVPSLHLRTKVVAARSSMSINVEEVSPSESTVVMGYVTPTKESSYFLEAIGKSPRKRITPEKSTSSIYPDEKNVQKASSVSLFSEGEERSTRIGDTSSTATTVDLMSLDSNGLEDLAMGGTSTCDISFDPTGNFGEMARLEYKRDFQLRKENVHRCDICCTYLSKSDFFMYNHMANRSCLRLPFNCEESNLEQYFCGICQLEFDTVIYLKEHILQEHSTERRNASTYSDKYICHNCSFQTSSFPEWSIHVTSACAAMDSREKDTRWFECNKCVYKTLSKPNLERHVSSKHANNDEKIPMKRFKCQKCTFQTSKTDLLKGHVIAMHTDGEPKKWFQCVYCTQKTPYEHNLRRHIKNKHTDRVQRKSFNCEKCTYITTRKDHLKKHIYAKHTLDQDKEWFQCAYCIFKTSYKSGLIKHVNSKHTDDQDKKWFRCEQCIYRTMYKSTLKRHIKMMHTGKAGKRVLL